MFFINRQVMRSDVRKVIRTPQRIDRTCLYHAVDSFSRRRLKNIEATCYVGLKYLMTWSQLRATDRSKMNDSLASVCLFTEFTIVQEIALDDFSASKFSCRCQIDDTHLPPVTKKPLRRCFANITRSSSDEDFHEILPV